MTVENVTDFQPLTLERQINQFKTRFWRITAHHDNIGIDIKLPCTDGSGSQLHTGQLYKFIIMSIPSEAVSALSGIEAGGVVSVGGVVGGESFK